MNALAPLPRSGALVPLGPAPDALPALIERASLALARARTAAEILEVHHAADLAYDGARRAARLMKARGAHDEIVAAALRAQGDALLIEAHARIRLAEEYEAARDRGEVARQGERNDLPPVGRKVPTLADLGLSQKMVKRARHLCAAERDEPGFVDRFIETRLNDGLAPSKHALQDEAHRALNFSSETELNVYVKRRRAERQAEKAEKRIGLSHKLADRTRAAAAELGRTLYPVLYVDFPWRDEAWSEETGMDRTAGNHYPTLSDEEVKAFPLPAGPTAILYMWATVPKLDVALDALRGFGFVFKSAWGWTKPDIGLGRYGRENLELILIGTRGGMFAPLPGQQPPMAQMAPRGRRHSEKPALFADCIARLYPDLPRIELFARGPRDGWDVWGNQADGVEP